MQIYGSNLGSLYKIKVMEKKMHVFDIVKLGKKLLRLTAIRGYKEAISLMRSPLIHDLHHIYIYESSYYKT